MYNHHTATHHQEIDMTYKQYEPCEHRHGSGLMGTYVDHYSTPCPTCAEIEESSLLALLALLALCAGLPWLFG